MNWLRGLATNRSHGVFGSMVSSWKLICQNLDTKFETDDLLFICRCWLLYGRSTMPGTADSQAPEPPPVYWNINATPRRVTWRGSILFAVGLSFYIAAQIEMDTQYILKRGYWPSCGRVLHECTASLAMAAAGTFVCDFTGSAICEVMHWVAKKVSVAIGMLAGREAGSTAIDMGDRAWRQTVLEMLVCGLQSVAYPVTVAAQLALGRALASLARSAGGLGWAAASSLPTDVSKLMVAFPWWCFGVVGALALWNGRGRFVWVSLGLVAMSASHPCFTDIYTWPPTLDTHKDAEVGTWKLEVGLQLVLQLLTAALVYTCGLLMLATFNDQYVLLSRLLQLLYREDEAGEKTAGLKAHIFACERRKNWLGIGWAVSRATALHLVEMTAHQAAYIMFSELARVLFSANPEVTADVWLKWHLHTMLLAKAVFSGQGVALVGFLPVVALFAPLVAVAACRVVLWACRGLVHFGYGYSIWCLAWWTRWTPAALEDNMPAPSADLLQEDMGFFAFRDCLDRVCFPYLFGGMQWRPYRRLFSWTT